MVKAERQPTGLAGADDIPSEMQVKASKVGGQQHLEDEPEEDFDDTPVFATPQQVSRDSFVLASASSRPVTRSMGSVHFDVLKDAPKNSNRLREKLRGSVRKSVSGETSSSLEHSRDIKYVEDEEKEGDDADVDTNVAGDDNAEMDVAEEESGTPSAKQSMRRRRKVGQLRVPIRRSARIDAQKTAVRDSTPSMALAAVSCDKNRVSKRERRGKFKGSRTGVPPRRSARLAKPLEHFHKYEELPNELKIMIWEAAVDPRLVYLCNRSSSLHPWVPFGQPRPFGVQNKRPSWFMACRLSVWVAQRHFENMFVVQWHQAQVMLPPPVDLTIRQVVNPAVDIVIFEPCHGGCRGYYCARHQYTDKDRMAVRFLAVQIDSPNLDASSEAGWVTTSRSWPNVETLYFMKPAIKGQDQREKAMIRIKEGEHEVALRKRFDEWKKAGGRDVKITTLEFVEIVEQEAGGRNIKERYKSVENRKTGLPEDVIIG